jgi:hypothetical protein
MSSAVAGVSPGGVVVTADVEMVALVAVFGPVAGSGLLHAAATTIPRMATNVTFPCGRCRFLPGGALDRQRETPDRRDTTLVTWGIRSIRG